MKTALRKHVNPRLRFVVDPPSEGGAGGGSDDGSNPPATGDDDSGDDGDDDKLGDAGKRALKAERDARAKAEADLKALQKQIDDSKKTSEQKAADDLAAAQRDAADAQLRALRYEVAATKGLDLKLAPRLSGSTKAELEADADDLKALLPDAKSGSGGLKPDKSQGGGSGDADKAKSVAAGRDLYAERHPSKSKQS